MSDVEWISTPDVEITDTLDVEFVTTRESDTGTWKRILLQGDASVLSNITPLSVGTTGSVGIGLEASRQDHVHDLGADCIDSGNLIADNVIDSEHIATDAIGNSHIDETETGFELSQIKLTPKSSGIGIAEGSIFYDSDDDNLYVYVV